MTTTFTLGQEVRFAGLFRTGEDGPLTDPSTITLYIIQPDNTELTYTYAAAQIVKDATGLYHFDFVLTASGHYHWRWEADGAVITAHEGVIYVPPSPFDDSVPLPPPPLGTGDDGKIARVQGGVYQPYAGVSAGDYLRWTGSAWVSSTFAIVPGSAAGGPGEVQYNNAGVLDGASGVKVAGSETALAFGATPAASGLLRVPHGSTIAASRNQAGSADVQALSVGFFFGANDAVKLGGTGANVVALDVKTGGSHGFLSFQFDGSQVALMSPTALNMGGLYAMFGGSSATAGMVRMPHAATILGTTKDDGTTDVALVDWGSATANRLTIGTSGVTETYLNVATSGTYNLQVNGATEYTFSSTQLTMNGNNLVMGAGFESFGTSPATTGLLRVPGSTQVILVARNAANSQNIALIQQGNADDLVIGDNSFSSNITYGLKTGGSHKFQVNNTDEYTYSSTAADFKDNVLQFGSAPATSGTIRLTNNQAITSRNTGNSANLQLINLAADNTVYVGDQSASELNLEAGTNVDLDFSGGTNPEYRFNSSSFSMTGNVINFNATTASTGKIRFGVAPGSVLSFLAHDGTTTRTAFSITGDGSTFSDVAVGDSNATTGNTTLYINAKTQAIFQLGAANEYIFNPSVADFTNNALQFGTNPATSGSIRFPHGSAGSILGRNSANSADRSLLRWGITATDELALGSISADTWLHALATVGLFINAVTEYTFGATVADFKDNALQFGTNPAGSGLVRFPANTTMLTQRNAANSADMAVVYSDASDNQVLGDFNRTAGLYLDVKTGGGHNFRVNNVTEYNYSSTAADFKDNNLLMVSGQIRFGSANFATSGAVNIPHSIAPLAARNNANTSDVILLNWGSGTDTFDIGGAGGAIAAGIGYGVASGGSHTFKVNNANELVLNATTLDLVDNDVVRGNVANASATRLLIRGTGSTASNNDGGRLRVAGGRRAGTGNYGAVALSLNTDDATFQNMVEAVHLANARRALALCRTADLTTTELPTNAGDLVIYVGDAGSVPSANAASGHVYYSDGGKPAWRYNSVNLRLDGTATTATAGGQTLPNAPAGFLSATLNGTTIKIPYYNN